MSRVFIALLVMCCFMGTQLTDAFGHCEDSDCIAALGHDQPDKTVMGIKEVVKNCAIGCYAAVTPVQYIVPGFQYSGVPLRNWKPPPAFIPSSPELPVEPPAIA